MGVLKKLVKGEYSLAFTYWVFEWLINTVILTSLLRFLLSSTYDPIKLWAGMLLAVIIIKAFLSTIIFMGIYSIIKKGGKTFWRVTALILQILAIIGILFVAVKFVPLILKVFIFL